MDRIDYSGVDWGDAAPEQAPSDYSLGVNPNTILRDPRFIHDLRSYYRSKGHDTSLMDDEDLIDRFYGDSTWRDLNTLGALGGAAESFYQDKPSRERSKRIEQVWRQLPNFWKKNGRGWKTAVPDIAKSIVLDPVNLIPVAGAGIKGANVARAAAAAGKSNAAVRGTVSGATTAAGIEAGIGAGQEAVVNTAHQLRDKQLGLRDSFSKTELGVHTALGGILGGGIGGALGTVPAAIGARKGVRDVENLRKQGLNDEQITEAVKNFGKPRPPTPTQEDLPPIEPETIPDEPPATQDGHEAMEQHLEKITTAARESYDNAASAKVDVDTLDDLANERNEVVALRQAYYRLKLEDEEISALERSNDVGSLKRAATRRHHYEDYMSRFRRILQNTNDLEDPSDFLASMEKDGFGLRTDRPKEEKNAKPTQKTDTPAEDGATPEATPTEPSGAASAAPDSDPVPPAPEAAFVEGDTAFDKLPFRKKAQKTEISKIVGDTFSTNDLVRLYNEGKIKLGSDGMFSRASIADMKAAAEISKTNPPQPEPRPVGFIEKFDDLPFRTPGQKTEISRLLTDDFNEQTLVDLFNTGEIYRAKDGKFSRASINAIKDAVDGDIKTPAPERKTRVQTTDVSRETPDAPNIRDSVRGRALAVGVDWRSVPANKNGTITRESIKTAETRRKGRFDDYAQKVNEDLTVILNIISKNSSKLTANDLRDAVAIMSKDKRFKGDEADIVALFDYMKRRASDGGIQHNRQEIVGWNPEEGDWFTIMLNREEFNRRKRAKEEKRDAEGFTATERKAITAQIRSYKKTYPFVDPDILEAMATSNVVKARADDRSSVRSTQKSIDTKAIYKGLGRNPDGTIQRLLLSGQGREFHVSKSLMSREEAMLRGKIKKYIANELMHGKDFYKGRQIPKADRDDVYVIVPYVSITRERNVITPDGRRDVIKGTQLYAEPRTNRVFTDLKMAQHYNETGGFSKLEDKKSSTPIGDSSKTVRAKPLDRNSPQHKAGKGKDWDREDINRADDAAEAARESRVSKERKARRNAKLEKGGVTGNDADLLNLIREFGDDDDPAEFVQKMLALRNKAEATPEPPEDTLSTKDLLADALKNAEEAITSARSQSAQGRKIDAEEGHPSQHETEDEFDEDGLNVNFETEEEYHARLAEEAEAAETPDTEKSTTPPVEKPDGSKLIVQHVSRPDDIRMISLKQIDEGKDISAIIGQNKDSPDADPANWIVKYAPMDAYARTLAQKKRLWKSLPDEDIDPNVSNYGAGSRNRLGNETGDSTPISMREYDSRQVNLTPEEESALEELLTAFQIPFEKSPVVTGKNLRDLQARLHASEWRATLGSHNKLIELYEITVGIQNRMAPEGYVLDLVDRQKAITDIEKVFGRYGAEEVERAREFLRRLGGHKGKAPIIDDLNESSVPDPEAREAIGEGDGTFAFNPETNNVVIPSKDRPFDIRPTSTVLYHEVAHWAYLNILTDADRIDFMKQMRKHYKSTGGDSPVGVIDRESVREAVSMDGQNVAGLDVDLSNDPAVKAKLAADPDYSQTLRGDKITVFDNGESGMAELFAKVFERYATKKLGKLPEEEEKFWRRVTVFVENIFKRYFSEEDIDPELEKLFAKILPDSADATKYSIGLGATHKPKSDIGPYLSLFHGRLQQHKTDIEDAFRSGSDEGVLAAHEELVKTLIWLVRSPKRVGKEGAYTAIFSPMRQGKKKHQLGVVKIIRNRIRDMDEMLSRAPRSFDDIAETYGEAVDQSEYLARIALDQNPDLDKALKEIVDNDPAIAAALKQGTPLHGLLEKNDGLRLKLAEVISGNPELQRIIDGDDELGEKNLKYFTETKTGIGASGTSSSLHKGEELSVEHLLASEALEDFYYNGYGGKFEPKDGVPSIIKNMEATSTSFLIDMLQTRLDNWFQRVEAKADINPPANTTIKPGRSRNAEGKVEQSDTLRRAKRAEIKRGSKATKQANAVANTPRSKRSSRQADIEPDESLLNKSASALYKMFDEHRDTELGDQIALAIVQKARTAPPPAKKVKVDRVYIDMYRNKLQEALIQALYDGDKSAYNQIRYEMARRAHNRGGGGKITPIQKNTFEFIRAEVKDNKGLMTNDAVPPGAPAAVRYMLSHITHRDAPVEQVSRTIAYRIFNILNTDSKDTLDTQNRVSESTMARLSGRETLTKSKSTGYKVDDFNKFRSQIRKIAVTMTKPGAQGSEEALGNLAKLVMRSGALEQEEHTSVIKNFVSLGSPATDRSGFETEQAAEDWFAQNVVDHLNNEKKATRIDFGTSSIEYNSPTLPQHSTEVSPVHLNNALNRTIEYMAYILNGQISRDAIKNKYMRLALYGDMFSSTSPHPMAGGLTGNFLTHPSYSADMAHDTLRSMGKTTRENVDDFVTGGRGKHSKETVGYDSQTKEPRIFYAGTGQGAPYRKITPGTGAIPGKMVGPMGRGTYVMANPHAASDLQSRSLGGLEDSLYSQAEAMRNADNASEFTDIRVDKAFTDIDAVMSIRYEIQRKRRKYNMKKDSVAALEGDRDASPERIRTAIKQKEAVEAEIHRLLRFENNILGAIERKYDIREDRMVFPVVMNMEKPFDIRENAYMKTDDPFIASFLDEINQRFSDDTIITRVMQDIEQDLATRSRSDTSRRNYRDSQLENKGRVAQQSMISTASFHSVLTEHLGRMFDMEEYPEDAAKNEINEILEYLGYDGIVFNSRDVFQSGDTLGLSTLPPDTRDPNSAHNAWHDIFVSFQSHNKVRHLNDPKFKQGTRPSSIMMNTSGLERGTVGAVTELIADGKGPLKDNIPVGEFGELLEQNGADPNIVGALMSMATGRKLKPSEIKALGKEGYSRLFRSQSGRMRRMGAKTLGDWFESHFPEVNQFFAANFYPIMTKLERLPGADKALRRYFRRSTSGVLQKQPEAHAKIVRALRRGDDSRAEKLLTGQEREIYREIRSTLRDLRQQLLNSGFHVGDRGPNYLPQIWNQNQIRKHQPRFMAAMRRYFFMERARHNITGTDEEAEAFARGVTERLLDEGTSGTFIPVKGTTRNPNFENVDYSRVIELEKYPAALNELEDFLESDLEAVVVKYLEGASRRLVHAKELGVNSHGVSDYLTVAGEGVEGITRLLVSPRQFRRDISSMTPDGVRESQTVIDTIRMPFENNESKGREFAQRLVETANTSGIPVARQLLYSVAPIDPDTGGMNITYKRRADAIVNALSDFGGKERSIHPDDEKFIEDAIRVAMKKPMMHTGGRDVMNLSRKVRFFNNITLLGFTTLTSLGDTVLPIIRSGSFTAWRKGLAEVARDPEYREMLRGVGVAMENILHERMIHLYGAPDGKASHAFFNATLLTPWTDMNRLIAGAVAHQSFRAMQDKAISNYVPGKSYAEQNRHYKTAHRYLKTYGLGAFLPGAERAGDSLGNRELIQNDTTVRMAIIRFADDSIFQPNPDDVPMFAQTPMGALIWQLKSFPMMMTRLGGHVLSESNKGNFKPLIYLATLGPAVGSVTLSAKDIVQMRGGEDGQSPELRKRNILKTLGYDQKVHGNENDFLGWWVDSILVMGGLGLIGDIIHSTVANADNGAYGIQRIQSTIFGPSPSLLSGGVTIGAGIFDSNKDSNAKERSAAREVATRIPVLGGIRRLRENIVDSIAGEAGANSNSWSSKW